MVGILSPFLLGQKAYFQGRLLLVSGSVSLKKKKNLSKPICFFQSMTNQPDFFGLMNFDLHLIRAFKAFVIVYERPRKPRPRHRISAGLSPAKKYHL